MKVYLDVCCLCRPFDKILNQKIYLESEAVHTILGQCGDEHTLVSSQVVKKEIRKISDPEKRNRVLNLLLITGEYVCLNDEIIDRARIFKQAGMRTFDALHLACAESAHAVFITSDDKIIRILQKNPDLTNTPVNNPVIWLMEEENG